MQSATTPVITYRVSNTETGQNPDDSIRAEIKDALDLAKGPLSTDYRVTINPDQSLTVSGCGIKNTAEDLNRFLHEQFPLFCLVETKNSHALGGPEEPHLNKQVLSGRDTAEKVSPDKDYPAKGQVSGLGSALHEIEQIEQSKRLIISDAVAAWNSRLLDQEKKLEAVLEEACSALKSLSRYERQKTLRNQLEEYLKSRSVVYESLVKLTGRSQSEEVLFDELEQKKSQYLQTKDEIEKLPGLAQGIIMPYGIINTCQTTGIIVPARTDEDQFGPDMLLAEYIKSVVLSIAISSGKRFQKQDSRFFHMTVYRTDIIHPGCDHSDAPDLTGEITVDDFASVIDYTFKEDRVLKAHGLRPYPLLISGDIRFR